MNRQSDQPGFVLLVVLLILSIAAAITANFAYSLAAYGLSVDAWTHARQDRYRLEATLEALRMQWSGGPLRQILQEEGRANGSFWIGEGVVQYQVWDEGTKFKVEAGTRQVLPVEWQGQLRRSGQRAAETQGPLLFEDIFEIAPDQLTFFYGHLDGEEAPIDTLTLWGDGRVNIHTAGEAVLRARLADLDPITIESVLQLKRYRQIGDIESLVSRLGLPTRSRQMVQVRLIAEPRTLTVRLACHGPRLRIDGFAVLNVEHDDLVVMFWRDLPAAGPSRIEEFSRRESRIADGGGARHGG